MRIVVVEDEDDLREDIVFNLADAGFDAIGVGDGAGLARELRIASADIVILDVGLPGEDGYAIARRLRGDPLLRSVGIIMLTAMGALDDRVRGLKDGADTYLVKPIDFVELIACIESLERRLALAEPADCWRFSPDRWELASPAGTRIRLTLTEKKLLEILILNAGAAVTRRDIIKGLGESPANYDERRLEAAVSRLRRKIEQAYPSAQPIQGARSIGYAFTGPVARE
ncbi:MAG: response regulator transcription factor [Sulfuricella sp.]|nr:response regulator transcription factor [Sulfuricella sp.]